MTADLRSVEVELWPGASPAPAWCLSSTQLRVTISALGAHVALVEVREGDGWRRFSVPYPDAPDAPGYHGATAGRWANRIARSAFDLDGVRHQLESNEGANQLHGGPDGFDRRIWVPVAQGAGPAGSRLELTLISPHGDQGFPGRLDASATFVVDEDVLSITYGATTDRPTVVNLTSHPYWNLGDSGTLEGHQLSLRASRVVAVDAEELPVAGPPMAVEGSDFDCRRPRDLGQVVTAGGYNNCFLIDAAEGSGDTPEGPAAALTHDSGRRIEITTDQPGIQVYTGAHLARDRQGVALETQRVPDAPNRPDLGESVLRPGESYRNHTTLRFGPADE